MQDKEKVIKTYLFAICARYPKVDKESLLEIWLQEFDYLDEKEEYMVSFMVACRKIINDSSAYTYRMPSPDDIKHVTKESLEPKTTNIKRPVRGMRPEFKKVFDKWKDIFGKYEKNEEDKKNLKELSEKMIDMTRGT